MAKKAKASPRKWQPEDVAPGPTRCAGPKRTVGEAAEWLEGIRKGTDLVLTAGRKRLDGEVLTRAEERAIGPEVTGEKLDFWAKQTERMDALIKEVKALPEEDTVPGENFGKTFRTADGTAFQGTRRVIIRSSLRELVAQHGLGHLATRIRNWGCGADLRDVVAELLNDGTMQEDGQEVEFNCPSCGASHEWFRTAPRPESKKKPAAEAVAPA